MNGDRAAYSTRNSQADGTRNHQHEFRYLPFQRPFGFLILAFTTWVANYYHNFVSSRFFGYQLMGGIGSLTVKILMPQLGLMDNSTYLEALWLQVAGLGGHFALQFPSYIYFESKHYGQPVSSVIREYFAWRTLEWIFNPGRYLDAFQANQTSGLFGDSLSAAATSLPLSLGQLGSMTTAPMIQGLYRRLQLKKESGVQTDHLEVYRIVRTGIGEITQTTSRLATRSGALVMAMTTLR